MNFRMSQIQPNANIDLEKNPKFLPDSYAIKYKSYLLKEGDVVIAMTDLATETKILGVPTIVPKDTRNWLQNQRVGKFFNIDYSKINLKFLRYILSTPTINDYFKSLGRGGLQINIGKQEILDAQIPLPPLQEQEKIVALLDEAFLAMERAKTNAELNLQNTKELFESYLQVVFENCGEGWEETILKNEVDLTTGFAFKSKFYSDKDDDILLIRGDNIMQGSFRWKDAKRWNKSEYADFEKFQMKENDIVLAMDRPWVKAGLKCARVTKLDLPSLLLQRTARLRNKSSINNSFLYYLINSKTFTDYLLGIQEGIGVPHISGKQIANYIFNLPSLQEQKTIVKKLNTLQAQTKKLESIYTQKLSDLEELKKSILQKAFSGELV